MRIWILKKKTVSLWLTMSDSLTATSIYGGITKCSGCQCAGSRDKSAGNIFIQGEKRNENQIQTVKSQLLS